MQIRSSLGPFEIPEILEDLTAYVLAHVKSEGLFRIGGSSERVRVLQERLLRGEKVPAGQPVQDVCSVLKRWLRKQGLFGKCVRPEYPPEHLEDLTTTLLHLAPQNVAILRHLCRFLQIVALNSASNLMDIDNLAGILGESVFAADVKVREVVTAEVLKRHSEVAKQCMKVLIESADLFDTMVDSNFRTPERPRERESKKSFSTRMKSYGSALKNLTLKRTRSLSLETKPEFVAPQLFEFDERIQLRERKGTMTQDTTELLERRNKAIARKIERVCHNRNHHIIPICHKAPTVAHLVIPCDGKENKPAPIRGRTMREFSLEEPQQLEWKSLPLDSHVKGSNTSLALRARHIS